jgi:hypothetical protein
MRTMNAHHAIRAEGPTLLKEYLCADFVRVFMAVGRAKCERRSAEPAAPDFTWYPRFA